MIFYVLGFFVFGFIAGILLTNLIISIILRNRETARRIIHRGYPLPRDFKKMQAEFFDSGSKEEDAMEILYEEHRKRGEEMKIG